MKDLSKTHKKIQFIFNTFTTLSLLAWGGDLWSKPNIQDLTSKKTSDKVSSTIPKKSRLPNYTNLHSIGIGVGQTFLKSEFKKKGQNEIGVPDFFYNYSASHTFDLLVNLHASTHGRQEHETKIRGLALGIKGKVFQFDSFSPFVVGGFGFYNPTVTRWMDGSKEPEETEGKITFGVHFGGGAELRLNRYFSVGALFHVHNPFDVNQDFGKEVEGSYYKLLFTTFYSF
jgi:hypothetical protein